MREPWHSTTQCIVDTHTLRPRTALIALISLACLAPAAHAGGINHFEAAPGPHNYVVTNHPAVLPHLVPSAWLLLSYAHDPLVFRDADTQRLGVIYKRKDGNYGLIEP